MAHTFTTNLKSVASRYIKTLQASVTENSIKEAVEENPAFPSLLSISEAFSRYNIPNGAYRIPRENFMEYDLEAPFVAFVKDQKIGEDFILVTDINDEKITYTYGDGNSRTIPIADFLDGKNGVLYRDVIWKAELKENSGDRNYEAKLQLEKAEKSKRNMLTLAGAAMVAIAVLFQLTSAEPAAFLSIFSIKAIGLAVSVLLLIYEVDKSNAFVKNICSLNAKTNCDAVLNSKAAKIKNISWSEMGFFYFAATFTGLLIPGIDFSLKTALVVVTTLMASPYIIFSIYYQWRVIKQWCPMCLAIQMVLLSEVIWVLFQLQSGSFVDTLVNLYPTAFLISAFCLLLPIVVWSLIKPVLIKAKNHDTFRAAYKRLQYNPELFNHQLQSRREAPNGWHNLGIAVGNPDAEHTLIKVCSPSCGPCSSMHPKLEEVIHNNPNINLRIIFTTTNHDGDFRKPITCHLMALAEQGNTEQLHKALDDWYLGADKNYETFAARYPLPQADIDAQAVKLEAMSKWCNEAHITHTPTVFVNGRELPENYEVEEMQYVF